MIVEMECSPCKFISHEPLQVFGFFNISETRVLKTWSSSFSPSRDHWIQRAGSGMGRETFSGSAEPALSEAAVEPQQGDFGCPVQLRPDFERHLQCLCWESVTIHTSGLRSFQHQMSLINDVLVLTVNLPYLSHSHLCQETCSILQE